MIDLAFFSGLRVSEIANLKIRDLKFSRAENLIFVSKDKGERKGFVTIDYQLAKHSRAFLAWKELVGEKTDPGDPLLTESMEGGKLKVLPISWFYVGEDPKRENAALKRALDW